MKLHALALCIACAILPAAAIAGTLAGQVRDPNWYARPTNSATFGVGYYEYGVNANGAGIATVGGLDDTDIFGAFQFTGLPGGSYSVASWDVWWRSAYVFNVPVPASGIISNVEVRLRATMWGYPAFWDETAYFEFGQTFVATGPVSMIYLRNPLNPGPTHTVTIHQGGPGGPPVGVARSFNSYWDVRLIYGYGEMPTMAGQTYYLRIRASGSRAVICQMDPRPDFSDPMPGGHLWLGDAAAPTAYPDRDLGVTIMSDDDGLITDLYTRPGGSSFSGVTNVGQTFVARGIGLISAAFWLADGTFPTFVMRVLENGPGGLQVGTTKRGKPARPTADPEMLVLWAPGECPLTPGQTYYIEVSKDGGGLFNSVYVASGNPFAYGQAYTNGVARAGNDLAGTIMEEESAGSAARVAVKITSDPLVSEAERRANELTIRWTTDVASDSLVEYAVEHPPYGQSVYSSNLVTAHSLTVTGLQAHTLYHYRVTSGRGNYRSAISRDFVICTRWAASNLLTNPSFEEGSGPSPRSVIAGWSFPGGDVKASSGNHFFSLPPHIGSWFLQHSVNGSSSSNYIFQRVAGVTPGQEYTFSAWVRTDLRENNTWKYDEWDERGRLIHMRLGIDPSGGTNVNASTVQWTPRLYSHRHYTQLAKSAVAQGTNFTVFVRMQGEGGQWHLYSVDDCALTHEEIPTRLRDPTVSSNGFFRATVLSRANRSNIVEASTTLTNWSAITGFQNTTGSRAFTNSVSGTRRFYRARVAP
jgi:hypothetical protein